VTSRAREALSGENLRYSKGWPLLQLSASAWTMLTPHPNAGDPEGV
jgi:hypothetical protein